MKTKISYSLLLAALASGVAFGQTAYTTPVGYVSLGNTAGGNAVPANTDTPISIPLARSAEYIGLTASVDTVASTLTVLGVPAWSPSLWTSAPYYLIVTSGAQEGAIALITANTADTLSLSVVTGSLNGILANDKVRIEKCWTLGETLSSANIPASNGDQLLIFNGSAPGTNKSAVQIMTFTPSGWFGTFGPLTGSQGTYQIGGGAGYILRQSPAVPTGSLNWTDNQVYRPLAP